MADRQRPDMDERFTLDPLEGEEVLRHLLHADGGEEPSEDEAAEAEGS